MVFSITSMDVLVTLASLTLAVLVHTRIRKRTTIPYPPGPPRLPILGNLHQLPSGGFEWKAYHKMSKDLGSDIIYLRAAGKDFIFIHSLEAANDLLDKRSSIYSNRPRFPMINDLMGWGWMYSLVEYGDFWRVRRRLFTKYFQTGDPSIYQSHQVLFVRRMLPQLLRRPNDFIDIARDAIGGASLSIAYGLPIKEKNDPHIEIAKKALSSFNEAAVSTKFLVNVIPVLRFIPDFLPGAGFKAKAKHWTKYQEDLRNLPFQRALNNTVNGTAKASFSTSYLEQAMTLTPSKRKIQEEIIKDVAGVVFVGSVDTSLAAINTFYAAMLLFPDAQRRGQVELDRVLGTRLPELSDEKDLPYIGALIKEVIRWNPFVPLNLPHSNTEDDVYRGYYIPKGAIIVVNAWSLLQDENNYPEPTAFRPERFLRNGQLDQEIRDPRDVIFGFGRRICPGSQVDWSFLWLAFATILSTFEISNDVDAAGNPVKPRIEFHSSIACEPGPFKCVIRPRSKQVESLIRDLDLSDEAL